jgi:hypothetical protein
MSINYKEKYLKYKKKYFQLKNQSGGQPEMSEEEFDELCGKAERGELAEVLAAVDQDRRLATRADGDGWTLLIWACFGGHPLLALGLLERGANVHSRSSGGWDALMYASYLGHIAVCTVLLNRGADPDYHNQYYSALWQAASRDHLQVCLLLISRRANLMLALTGGTALAVYGESKYPRLTPDEIELRRAIVLTAFEQGPHPDMCWKRRWPMMNVMAGCGFRPLAERLYEMHLDTSEQGRAFYMKLIFKSDFLLRRIVSFL